MHFGTVKVLNWDTIFSVFWSMWLRPLDMFVCEPAVCTCIYIYIYVYIYIYIYRVNKRIYILVYTLVYRSPWRARRTNVALNARRVSTRPESTCAAGLGCSPDGLMGWWTGGLMCRIISEYLYKVRYMPIVWPIAILLLWTRHNANALYNDRSMRSFANVYTLRAFY